MKKLIPVICFLFFLLFIPAQHTNAATYTTTANVRLRQSSSMNASILTIVPKGTTVSSNTTYGSWYKVTYNNKTGYIYATYLKTKTVTGYVTSDNVNLRKSGSLSARVLKQCYSGDTVTILSTGPEWIRVNSKGVIGYIYKAYVHTGTASTPKITLTSSTTINTYRKRAIAYARSRKGDKYSMDKRNDKGYADCSSLMRDAFKYAAGVYIGENTTGQRARMESYMKPITKLSQVTVGDLVYHFEGNGRNHTGIYVGNGYVVHCSSVKGKVIESSFSDRLHYWQYSCNAAAYCYANK